MVTVATERKGIFLFISEWSTLAISWDTIFPCVHLILVDVATHKATMCLSVSMSKTTSIKLSNTSDTDLKLHRLLFGVGLWEQLPACFTWENPHTFPRLFLTLLSKAWSPWLKTCARKTPKFQVWSFLELLKLLQAPSKKRQTLIFTNWIHYSTKFLSSNTPCFL